MIIAILSIAFALIIFFSIPKFRASPYDFEGFSTKAVKKALRGDFTSKEIQDMKESIARDAVNKTNKSVTVV